jgi:hypothetical protein
MTLALSLLVDKSVCRYRATASYSSNNSISSSPLEISCYLRFARAGSVPGSRRNALGVWLRQKTCTEFSLRYLSLFVGGERVHSFVDLGSLVGGELVAAVVAN